MDFSSSEKIRKAITGRHRIKWRDNGRSFKSNWIRSFKPMRLLRSIAIVENHCFSILATSSTSSTGLFLTLIFHHHFSIRTIGFPLPHIEPAISSNEFKQTSWLSLLERRNGGGSWARLLNFDIWVNNKIKTIANLLWKLKKRGKQSWTYKWPSSMLAFCNPGPPKNSCLHPNIPATIPTVHLDTLK